MPDSAAGTARLGYLHCGPSGAGHFVKMVHNGIEYGMMAAYAEGVNILKAANAGKRARSADAETSPLHDAQYYQFDIDLPAVTEVWRHGSVIGSWLLDLTASALKEDPGLEKFGGRVSDSGEGAGRSRRRSTPACQPRCSRRRCSIAFRHKADRPFQTSCCRPCATRSAGIWRRRVSGGSAVQVTARL
jgi:hypothetical protein